MRVYASFSNATSADTGGQVSLTQQTTSWVYVCTCLYQCSLGAYLILKWAPKCFLSSQRRTRRLKSEWGTLAGLSIWSTCDYLTYIMSFSFQFQVYADKNQKKENFYAVVWLIGASWKVLWKALMRRLRDRDRQSRRQRFNINLRNVLKWIWFRPTGIKSPALYNNLTEWFAPMVVLLGSL